MLKYYINLIFFNGFINIIIIYFYYCYKNYDYNSYFKARYDSNFVDCNDGLFDAIRKKHPDCITLEMETFGLFHLAKCCSSTYHKKNEPKSKKIKQDNSNEIKTAATTMIFANRVK